ncbi:hypothetical protein HNR44_001718 [Geomicrobium halophilum]|uniref:MobA/MobL protein domain-containing protein n=1 Tax=Geomicrobium halophilum TaxID=549000 RepID=A0A841PLV4_9BACL|nr:MobQ family relaxase [Geomicrobium halophilum]MBB6449740.1 hypothetical protein [Geomicrobium halophilum]
MSHYMFRAQVINKKSQSAVASAAYRSGQHLYSERDGLTKNYARDGEVESFILSPEHAPVWAEDRKKLWNEVEKVEKQANAQLAREIVFALPKEISNQEQRQLTENFCKENFSNEGMVADINIHRDKEHNPHAHVMLTVRPFNEDGTWGAKRIRNDKQKESEHTTDWHKKETLNKWRENLAERINEKYHDLGINEKVSHESYRKQGLDKEPNIRLSRSDYQWEKRTKEIAKQHGKEYEPVTYYGKLNQELQSINKELESLQEQENAISLEEKSKEKGQQTSSLTDTEKAAMKTIAKRAKSYVDYSIALNIMSDLEKGSWKKKIDQTKVQIESQKNVISKAKKVYDKQPSKVHYYGFNKERFPQEMRQRIQEIKDLQSRHQKDQYAYRNMYETSKVALDAQERLTEQEFQSLYDTNQIFTTIEKYQALQYYKEHGELLAEKDIKTHASNNHMLKREKPIHEQVNQISQSILILDRGIKKEERKKAQYVYNRDHEGTFQASKKIEQYRLQKQQFENEINEPKRALQLELTKRYGDQVQTIDRPDVLVRLHHQSDRQTSSLENDLQSLEQEWSEKEKSSGSTNAKAYSQNLLEGIQQSLMEIEHDNQRMPQRDSTKKREKKRYRGQVLEHEQ